MVRHLPPARQGRAIVHPAWAFALRLLRQEADTHAKALMALALLFVLSGSALAALSPVLLKNIIDHLASGKSEEVWPALGGLLTAYVGSQWLTRSLSELQLLAVGRADQRLHRYLSLRLFKHVLALPLCFHLNRRTGALSQTLANGLFGYRILVQHLVTTVLPVLLEVIVMSTVLLLLNQAIFFAILSVSLLCYAILFSIGAVKLAEPARAVSAAHTDANALLTDSILNFETIKSFCAELRTQQRMEVALTQTERHWARFFYRKAMNGTLVGTIFSLSLGTSVYVAAEQVSQGRMSVGEFVLVNAYMLRIVRPMEMLGFAFRDISQGMAFIEGMVNVFRQTPEPSLTEGMALPPGAGELVFDSVFFSYGEERPILNNVSFKIPAGKTAALIGPSGSGKSSLIRLLVRFWEPGSGRILLDGFPIAEASTSSLRGAIAVIPQDTILFNDTFAQNISVGRAESSAEDIKHAAQVAHIHNFITSRPEGYDTLIGERGLTLSGGEKQRVAIARAALKRPRLFVFDEATSSLDSETEQQILRKFGEVSQGTTTLVIAHRLSTIIDADEILVLDKGELVDRGSHHELLRRPGIYRTMWVAQQHNLPLRNQSAI